MIRNITTVLLLSVVCSYAQLQPGYTFLTVRTNTDINSLIIPNITPASIGAISTNALPGLTNGFIGRTDATNIVNGIAISSNWVNGVFVTNTVIGLGASSGFIRLPDATNVVNGIGIVSNWVSGSFVTNVVNGIGVASNWVNGAFVTNTVTGYGYVTASITNQSVLTNDAKYLAGITNGQGGVRLDGLLLSAPTLILSNVTTSTIGKSGNTLSVVNDVGTPAATVAYNFAGASKADTAASTVLDGATSLTWSVWVYQNTTPLNNQSPFTQGANKAGIYISNNGGYAALINDAYATIVNSATYSVANLGWHLLTITWTTNAGHAQLYIDGSLSNERDNNSGLLILPYQTGNGVFNLSASSSFPGRLDEAAIWRNRILTATEISELYNAGAGLYIATNKNFVSTSVSMGAGLVGLWHLDEGAGTSLADSSASNKVMTLSASSGWTDGVVSPGSTTNSATVISSSDGVGGLEKGINRFGDVSGRTVLQGKTLRFNINATEYGNMDASGHLLIGDSSTGSSKLTVKGTANEITTQITPSTTQTSNVLQVADVTGTQVMLISSNGTTTHTRPVVVNGSTDQVQLSIKANATQNSNVFETVGSDGTLRIGIDKYGFVKVATTLSSGAGNNMIFRSTGKGNMADGAIWNTVFGDSSGVQLSTGDFNTLFGGAAGQNMLNTSSYNTVLGYSALSCYSPSPCGDENIAIGANAALNASNGAKGNTVIGTSAAAGQFIAGKYGVYIGHSSGNRLFNEGGSNVFIGAFSGYNQETPANMLIIDNRNRGTIAAEATNCLVVGIFAANRTNQYLSINGNVTGIAFRAESAITVGGNSVLTNIPTESTNLSAGILVYTNGILYGGTNIPAGGGIQLTDVTNVVNGIAVSSNWVDGAFVTNTVTGYGYVTASITNQSVLTNDARYLASITNIVTESTNLSAGILVYTNGILYGGTNIPAVTADSLTNAMINGTTGTVSAGMVDLGTGFLTNNQESAVTLNSTITVLGASTFSNVTARGIVTFTSTNVTLPAKYYNIVDQGNMLKFTDAGSGLIRCGTIQHVGSFGGAAYGNYYGLVYDTTDLRWEHVTGALGADSYTNYAGYFLFDSSKSDFIWSNTSTNGTNGEYAVTLATKMTLDKNGNLGVNTPTPTEKIHVVGNIKADGSIIGTSGAFTGLSVTNSTFPMAQFSSPGHSMVQFNGAAGSEISLTLSQWGGNAWKIGMDNGPTTKTNNFAIKHSNNATPDLEISVTDSTITTYSNLVVGGNSAVTGTLTVGGGLVNPGGITVPISLLPYVVNSTCTFTRAMIATNESWYIIPTNTVYFSADSTLTDSNIVSRFSLDIWYNDKTFGFDGGLSNTVTLVSNQPNSIIWFKGWGTTNMVGR